MTKFLWNALKLSPVILSASLLLANRTQAAVTPSVQLAPNSSAAAASLPPDTSLKQLVSSVPAGTVAESSEVKIADLNQTPQQVADKAAESGVSQPAQNTEAPDALSEETSVSQLSTETPDEIAQVTSVSQLSDVQPTDWAFQALQSLVERYGCIVGYPDSTYRGNRALTRYEFAAGLNSCLDRVNELIAAGTSDLVRREDLATLQRLQEEFSAEVATLRGRVDGLEARTAELESNQFSTTTKLTGEAIFNVGGAFGDERAVLSGRPDPTDNPDSPGIDDIVTFTGRVRLALNTSFFGTDLLRTRLQARNITPFGTNVTGTNMTRLAFDGDENNTFSLDQLFYRFPLFTDRIIAQIDVANTELDNRGFPTLSPFESSGRGSISRYGRFSPIYRQGAGGAGVSFALNPQGPVSLNVAYLAPTANNPNSGFGAANGAYAAIGQVTIKPFQAFSLGLTYAHTYDTPTRRTPQLFESTGGIFANAPFGITPTTGNHYGVEASLRLAPGLILFGWGGYTQAIAEGDPDAGAAINGTAITGNRGSKADIWYYAGGIALPDFGKEGSLLGLLFGQSPRVADNDVREVGFGNRRRIDNDTSYHAEGFYRFKLTDNIDIQPGVMVILNPEHNEDNPTEYVGTLRTTFTF